MIEEEQNKKQEILQKILLEERGIGEKEILPTTHTTNTTFTTKMNVWGFIDIEAGVVIEQLSKTHYIYNLRGEVGVTELKFNCPDCATFIISENSKPVCSCGRKLNTNQNHGLFIKEHTFLLDKKPSFPPIYLVPDELLLRQYLAFPNKIPPTQDLFNEIDFSLRTLFDFNHEADSKICSLVILFTYLLPYFNSVFNLGIDATKGSGKTTLLEIICLLMRHGLLADFSPASIPRLKQKYDLNIAVDEIDQLKNEEDLQGLVRRGQRRGNLYIRLNKTTLTEEIYEAFGFYAFSFRSIVEDAFKQRSIIIRTARAKDSRLSIINLDKKELLKPLFTKIFAWYIFNILLFGEVVKVVFVAQVAGTSTPDVTQLRDRLYLSLTKEFSSEQNKLISDLFGRNSEIGYLFLKTSKFIGIDLLKEIKITMLEKQEEEETSDDYYLEMFKTIFEDIKYNPNWLLSKGEFAGQIYYPKTAFYLKLVSKLKESNLMGIGTNKYNQLLKDIGFITNFNIKNQKTSGDTYPKPCLIFERGVLKKLGIDYTAPIVQGV